MVKQAEVQGKVFVAIPFTKSHNLIVLSEEAVISLLAA